MVWFGRSASLGLPLPGNVVLPVGARAESHDRREGVVWGASRSPRPPGGMVRRERKPGPAAAGRCSGASGRPRRSTRPPGRCGDSASRSSRPPAGVVVSASRSLRPPGGVVPVGAHAGACDRQEGAVWFGRSASLGLPLPGNVVLPVGAHAEAHYRREGVVWCASRSLQPLGGVVWGTSRSTRLPGGVVRREHKPGPAAAGRCSGAGGRPRRSARPPGRCGDSASRSPRPPGGEVPVEHMPIRATAGKVVIGD